MTDDSVTDGVTSPDDATTPDTAASPDTAAAPDAAPPGTAAVSTASTPPRRRGRALAKIASGLFVGLFVAAAGATPIVIIDYNQQLFPGPLAVKSSYLGTDRIQATAAAIVQGVDVTYTGKVTSYVAMVDSAREKAISKKANSSYIAVHGQQFDMQSSEETFLAQVAAERANPIFKRGKSFSRTGSVTVRCSGWFVDASHVVVPAQCVAASAKTITEPLANRAMKKDVEAGVKNEVAYLAKNVKGVHSTANMRSSIRTTYTNWFADEAKVADLKTAASIAVRSLDAKGKATVTTIDATVVTSGAAFPGSDVAVLALKTPVATAPSLPIAEIDSSSHPVAVAGIEGSVFGQYADRPRTSMGTVSATIGKVVAQKASSKKTASWQVEARDYSGGVGGVVVDETGSVAGMVVGMGTFGKVTYGIQEVVPASEIRAQLVKAGVTPVVGTTIRHYSTAVADGTTNFWQRALDGYTKVKALDPAFPGIDKSITTAEKAIAQGKDVTPELYPTWAVGGLAGVGALALILAVLVGWLVRRRG